MLENVTLFFKDNFASFYINISVDLKIIFIFNFCWPKKKNILKCHILCTRILIVIIIIIIIRRRRSIAPFHAWISRQCKYPVIWNEDSSFENYKSEEEALRNARHLNSGIRRTKSKEFILWEQTVVFKRNLPLQDTTQAVDFVGNPW